MRGLPVDAHSTLLGYLEKDRRPTDDVEPAGERLDVAAEPLVDVGESVERFGEFR